MPSRTSSAGKGTPSSNALTYRLTAVGLAVLTEDGLVRLLVANLTPRAQDIIVGPLHGPVAIRRLNEATAEHAGTAPAAFRRKSAREDMSGERGADARVL